jgi:hypothetical protein
VRPHRRPGHRFIHRNLRAVYVRDAITTNASNLVASATAQFTAEDDKGMVCVFGANVGGVGVNYLVGRVQYNSPTQINLLNPTTGAALNAQAHAMTNLLHADRPARRGRHVTRARANSI